MTEKNNTKKAVDITRTVNRRDKQNNKVTVSTGVVFTVKEVPSFALSDIKRHYKEPSPPLVYNEDTGRKEPNPDNPDYKRDYEDYMINMSMAIIDTMVLLGTAVHSVPENIPHPNSQEWSGELKGILRARGWSREELNELSAEEKYVYWVKYRGATGTGDGGDEDGDINKLTAAIGRLSGVTERDVKDAMDNFPDSD